MIGILVELAISWAMLWWLYRKSLAALGLVPTSERAVYFLIGTVISVVICGSYHVLSGLASENNWVANSGFTFQHALSGFWWTFKSVLFEELIFRGALLFIAIEMLGSGRAITISSAAFGIYHWFSFGAIGNPVMMIYLFISTGIAGLMFAYAFTKTKSLLTPIGLHLGWNFTNIVVFSSGPLGQQWFIQSNESQPTGISSILLLLFQVFALPTWVYLGLRSRNEKEILS